ncbi:hypothetical protein PHBOTO_000659 [Pseudozyma hubeiensis]|nr:hypothetical protein PHBOTO_000659 [Pseudozyma hubeiensis]
MVSLSYTIIPVVQQALITPPKMSTADEYSVALCTSGTQLRGVCSVRIEVFVKEQGFALADEIDQYDPLAAHFILTHNSDPSTALGTLRLLPYPLPIPKPDEAGAEPDPNSSYPLGGSRSESAIASDFISAAWSHYSPSAPSARDPAQTEAEEKETAKQMTEKGGAKLGRLALVKAARGKGLGHLLVRKAEEWLIGVLQSDETSKQGAFGPRPTLQGEQGETRQTKGSDEERLESIVIKLSSQIYVIDFYQKLGYTPVGDRYDEDGAPHQLCCKQVFLARS